MRGSARGPAGTTGHAPAPWNPGRGLLVMVVIWAVNFSVAKDALAVLPPLGFNALRFPLASLVVYAVLRARGPVPLPARADVPRVLVLGLVGNVLYQILFISGLAMTRAGIASLLLAGSPVLTALLSAAVGHERVGAATWVGVVATVAGMALVVLGGPGAQAGGSSAAGEAIMLGASTSWSLYTVGARDLVERYGPIPVTAWTLWCGTAGIVLTGAPYPQRGVDSRRSREVLRRPGRESQRRLPLDGPHETRSPARRGRPQPTTGCSATAPEAESAFQ